MSTNQQNKRKTKQVRVEESVHKKLKFEAVNQNSTISKLLDEIAKDYFKERSTPTPISKIL